MRIFLLEQDVGARDLLARRLDSVDRFAVIGAAVDHEAARTELWRGLPDVVVMDHLPAQFGQHPFFGAARAIGAGLVLHASLPPLLSATELQRAGVREVVLKAAGGVENLVAAIQKCRNGN